MNRNGFDILNELLVSCRRTPLTKYKLMCCAYVPHKTFRKYFHMLKANDLIEEVPQRDKHTRYVATEKGNTFITTFKTLRGLMGNGEV